MKTLSAMLLGLSIISFTYANTQVAVLQVAFLFNFARFVEWPDHKLDSNAPITLCFIGEISFTQALDNIRHKKALGHPLNIQLNISLAESKQCHILFIASSKTSELHQILDHLQQGPVLTVSNIKNFARHGGHIGFYQKPDQTLGLEINLKAIRHAQLNISSRILAFSKIIR